MQTTIIQRIEIFSKYKQITIRKLSLMIDFNYTTLNNYLNGRRNAIDIDLICKLVSSFDDINIEWILLGKGEMLKGVEKVEPSSPGTSLEMLEMISRLSGENALLKKELAELKAQSGYKVAAEGIEKYGRMCEKNNTM